MKKETIGEVTMDEGTPIPKTPKLVIFLTLKNIRQLFSKGGVQHIVVNKEIKPTKDDPIRNLDAITQSGTVLLEKEALEDLGIHKEMMDKLYWKMKRKYKDVKFPPKEQKIFDKLEKDIEKRMKEEQ